MLEYLRSIKYYGVFKWVGVNPKKSVFTGVLLGLSLIDHCLKKKGKTELQSPVYVKLLKGSNLPVPLNPKY